LDRAGGRGELLVCYSEARGYELIAWNRVAAELFGIPATGEESAPLAWDKLPLPLGEYLSQALAGASGAAEEVMPEFHHPDKPDRHYLVKVYYQSNPATPDQKEEHGYLFCFQDSASRVDSFQNTINHKKLETIGELASGVVHDFNNLIMGIHSNAEVTLAQPGTTSQVRDSLINIIRACSTGALLTRSLLGYAKQQPPTITSFNLIDLVHDVARIAGVASGKHPIALAKDLQEKSTPLTVSGSYSNLSHCLLNLIKNAREAMPDGGIIHVLWEGTENMATVTVRDHGAGISEQNLARIFEPFFSTKQQGTGLGLAMVRGILQQHSGTVEIRSKIGEGTAVSLVWPRNGAIPARPKSKDKEGTDVRRSTQRILKQSQRILTQSKRLPAEAHYLIYVIDDDDLVRDGLCSLLEHLGHRTQSFGDPKMALKALLSTETLPEVILVDYNMPEMNGAQFIGRYTTAVADDARHAETKIVLMSGLPPSYFQDFMSEFSQLKFGVLEKPFTLETLRKKILEIQARRSSGALAQVAPKVAPGVPRIVPRPNSSQLIRSSTPEG